MYPKISIKNLGPIKNLQDFEVRKVNLFIGESASGKSLLAKAIWIFNSQLFRKRLLSNVSNILFYQLFRNVFPPYKNYEIKYHYTKDSFIKIISNDEFLNLDPSEKIKKVIKSIYKIQQEIGFFYEKEKLSQTEENKLDFLIEKKQKLVTNYTKKINLLPTLFIPATRSFVSDFDTTRLKELNRMNRTRNIRSLMKINSADEMLNIFSDTNINRIRGFNSFENKNYHQIMKGEVYKESFTNKIFLKVDDDFSIEQSHWSSGQKEAFSILMILQQIVKNERPHLIVIEEPEAHLFPEDQKRIFDEIITAINKTDSKVIITTHAPVLLSFANNLMEAKKKNYQKYKDKFIDSKDLNVSKIVNGKVESAIDNEDGLIDDKFIDSVSYKLYDDFSEIVDFEENE